MAKITKNELALVLGRHLHFIAENGTRIFNGEYRSFDPEHNLINIIDKDRGGALRRIKLDTLKWLQVGGIKYSVADIVDEVRVVFQGEGNHPKVNGYPLNTVRAHQLLLGNKLESVESFGLDGYTCNKFTIDGRTLRVRFSGKTPQDASNQREMMTRLKARIEDVRTVFSAPYTYNFTVEGVEFKVPRSGADYRVGFVTEGQELADKLGVENTMHANVATVFGHTMHHHGEHIRLAPHTGPITPEGFERLIRDRVALIKAEVERIDDAATLLVVDPIA